MISMINTALLLTYVRVGFIPLIILFYYLPFHWAHVLTVILFVIAGLTDWLDGYLARHWKQMTKLGAFLDPVADKLLVAAVLVILVDRIQLPVWFAIPSIVIIGREILVSALREWMAEIGKRSHIDVVKVAKYKTAGIAQLVEHNLAKVGVASSSLVSRF
jgi:CDP-diacylglycerol--glycerol-3-phosphate 3-phosphatidyltransferase